MKVLSTVAAALTLLPMVGVGAHTRQDSPGAQSAAASKPEQFLVGHAAAILSVAFSRDGRRVAAGGQEGGVFVFDAATGDEVKHVPFMYSISGVAFVAEDAEMVTASWNLQFWNLREARLKHHLESHVGFLTCLATDAGAKWVVTGALDNTVKVWDIGSAQELKSLPHPDQLNALAVSPDGKWLAGAGDTTVRIWSTSDWKEAKSLKQGSVTVLAWSPDGKTLACGTQSGKALLLTGESWDKARELPAHKEQVTGAAWIKDGKTLITGGDTTVRFTRVEDGSLAGELAHPAKVTSLAVSPDGKRVVTGCKDGIGRIWVLPGTSAAP
jgi:WD40 repeat protein